MNTKQTVEEENDVKWVEKHCGIRAGDNLSHYLASVSNLFQLAVSQRVALRDAQEKIERLERTIEKIKQQTGWR